MSWSGVQKEYTVPKFIELSKEVEIIAFCPSSLGGFEGLEEKLRVVLPELPKLKALVLNTTAFGYIPLDIVKKQNIIVTHIPAYSRESVAEHVLAMMLAASKRILLSDRATQLGKYEIKEGMELANKTLGVIGLGSIGSRVAELGRAIGMRVLGWDRNAKFLPGIEQLDLETVLRTSDVLSLHLAENTQTHGFLSLERINLMKSGAILVNTADRALVDEQAIAQALKTGKVDSYVLEAEDFESGPLATAPNMFFLKGFGWYTKESLERNKQIWSETLESVLQGKPKNIIEPLK